MQRPGLASFIEKSVGTEWIRVHTVQSPEGCRAGGGEGEGCLASLDSLASCLLPAHDSTGAAPAFRPTVEFFVQVSSYNIVQLAVAEPGATGSMRHLPEDTKP
jgi:hypothetical protein